MHVTIDTTSRMCLYAFVHLINPPWPSEPVPHDDLAGRLTQILDTLRKMAAATASKRWVLIPLAVLLHNYLSGVCRRFESLVLRLRAGPIAARRARPKAARPQTFGPQPSPADSASRPRLPARFAWVIEMIPYHAAGIGSQLRVLLSEPAMKALIEADPRAGRILRPVCRMLGIEPAPDLPPSLFPPASPAPIEPPPAAKPPTVPASWDSALQPRSEDAEDAAVPPVRFQTLA